MKPVRPHLERGGCPGRGAAGRVVALVVMVVLGAPGLGWAQISSVTRRTLQTPPAITVFVSTNTVVATPPRVIMAPPPKPAEKTEAEKAEEQQRAVAFVKQRAEAGKAVFQYDLGVRYLRGEGVERDVGLARKWFAAAAKQGHEPAKKRLEEMDKPPPAAR